MIYRGLPDGRTVNVLRSEDITEVASVTPLPHYSKHSPTGFTWGYSGSGPAELARCLLIDALGERARCGTCEGTHRVLFDSAEHARPATPEDDPWAVTACLDCDPGGIAQLVEGNYQALKEEMIAPLDQDAAWTIDRQAILDWLAAREAVPSTA